METVKTVIKKDKHGYSCTETTNRNQTTTVILGCGDSAKEAYDNCMAYGHRFGFGFSAPVPLSIK